LLQDEHGHTIHDPRALDPREAIIAHAAAAQKNPLYTKVLPLPLSRDSCCSLCKQAYANTQPKAIYHQEDSDGGCCAVVLWCCGVVLLRALSRAAPRCVIDRRAGTK